MSTVDCGCSALVRHYLSAAKCHRIIKIRPKHVDFFSVQPVSVALGEQRRIASVSRLFVPSVADLFLIFFIFWAFLASPQGWQGLLRDADTGFHIRAGEWIINAGNVPIHDPFSFARPDAHWYAFEWISQVLFAVLNGWAGLKGVVLFSGALLAVTFTIVLRHAMWRGAGAIFTIFLALLAASAASLHFHARPHIFTMLLLAIALWILDRDRRTPSGLVWILPLLTVLWANLHGGFAMFVALAGLLVLGSVLEGGKSRAGRYGLLFLLCAAASAVNPYGVRLPLHVFEVVRSKWMLSFVDEFRAPDFRSESHLAFMVLLFASLAVLIPLVKKGRITEALWILFLAYCSLTAVRHVPLFAIVSVPIIAAEWTALLSEFRAGRSALDSFATATGSFAHTSIWPVCFICALALAPGIAWPANFDQREFPVGIGDGAPQRVLAERIYTTDQWANYLIFKNPKTRVFIDSQHQIYGEAVLSEALGMMSGRHDWRELLDRYQIETVLCPRDAALASLLVRDAGWTQVAATPQASLFSRNALP